MVQGENRPQWLQTTTLRPVNDQLSAQALRKLVEQADRSSPPSPHKPFVTQLVKLVHEAEGVIHAESWYRKAIADSGCTRRPSTRTVSAVVAASKERFGLDAGPTQAAVRKLRSQFTDLLGVAAEIKACVDRLEKITERQLAISEAHERRQLLMIDQTATHQRQVEELKAVVQQQAQAARQASSGAADIALECARALRDIRAAVAQLPASR